MKRRLGLDIRTDRVEAMLVSSDLKGNRRGRSISVPYEAAQEGKDVLAEALEVVIATLGISAVPCRAAIPVQAFDFNSLTVPFSSKKQVAQILPFELEPKIAIPPEDLVIDFQTIQNPTPSDGTVLWAAMISNRELNAYLESFTKVRLTPEIITFSGISAAQELVAAFDLPREAMALDVNKNGATLFFLMDNQIVLVRHFLCGPEDKSFEAVLLRQIRYSLTAFDTTWPGGFKPQGLFLTGWYGEADGWGRRMSQRLDIPVKHVDLCADIHPRVVVEDISSWSPGQQNDALALGVRKSKQANVLNFRKSGMARNSFIRENQAALITSAIMLLLAVLVLVGNLMLNNHILKQRITRTDSETVNIFKAAMPQVRKIVDPLQQMRTALDERRKAQLAPKVKQPTTRILDILNTISRHIPAQLDMELKRLSVGPEDLVLTANTDHFNTVNEIQKHLEKTFGQVKIGSVATEKATNRVAFTIKIELK